MRLGDGWMLQLYIQILKKMTITTVHSNLKKIWLLKLSIQILKKYGYYNCTYKSKKNGSWYLKTLISKTNILFESFKVFYCLSWIIASVRLFVIMGGLWIFEVVVSLLLLKIIIGLWTLLFLVQFVLKKGD